MSTAYWCILIAALLPYVWVAIAKSGAPGYNNKDPRGWIAKQDSYRVRNAHAAHLNAFEAFAPFAAAVLMAVAVPLIAFLEQSALFLLPLEVAMVAGVVGFIWWRRRRRENLSRPQPQAIDPGL